MGSKAFETVITETSNSFVGPWRRPHQMLNAQLYDSHASIHDDATAQKLGFQGGTIEGPTHFSQFAPLCENLWGKAWFETGCISAHYRNPSFEGEEVQAILTKPEPGATQCKIQMVKRDGTEVLRGTASVGSDGTATALDQRLTELKPLADPVILHDVKVGMKTGRQTVRMGFDQNMGELTRSRSVRNSRSSPNRVRITGERKFPATPGAVRSFRSRCSACCFNIDQRRSVADQGSGGRPVRRSGDPADPRAVIRGRGL